MDISASQYNSASESGWTHYLDQSSLISENYFQRRISGSDFEHQGGKGATMGEEEEEEEEEEDLSMVSDASSGPPHYDDASSSYCCENWCYPNSQFTKASSSSQKEKKKKKKMMMMIMGNEYGRIIQQQPSTLDDTASSPIFNFPKESHKKQVNVSGNGTVEDAFDFSQCLSVTRIKRKPKFQKQFRGKQASEEPGGYYDEQGRK